MNSKVITKVLGISNYNVIRIKAFIATIITIVRTETVNHGLYVKTETVKHGLYVKIKPLKY